MIDQMIIASIQMYSTGDKERNLQTMEKYLEHINKAFPNIKMVVFPELAAHGSISNMRKEAEAIPGELTSIFSNMANKYNLWLIPGSIYEKSGNEVFNTTPVFSSSGDLLGKYRKRYPWRPNEKTTPGGTHFTFDVDGFGTVGIMICYDIWFPEVARDLVHNGAEVIIVPTMTTTGDRPQEKIIVQSTAITHQAYVVSCNGVGRGGVGGSLIVDPEGVVLQESGEGPYMQTALIDFERVRYVREKGTSGVTTPFKEFRRNKQKFSVYKDKD